MSFLPPDIPNIFLPQAGSWGNAQNCANEWWQGPSVALTDAESDSALQEPHNFEPIWVKHVFVCMLSNLSAVYISSLVCMQPMPLNICSCIDRWIWMFLWVQWYNVSTVSRKFLYTHTTHINSAMILIRPTKPQRGATDMSQQLIGSKRLSSEYLRLRESSRGSGTAYTGSKMDLPSS